MTFRFMKPFATLAVSALLSLSPFATSVAFAAGNNPYLEALQQHTYVAENADGGSRSLFDLVTHYQPCVGHTTAWHQRTEGNDTLLDFVCDKPALLGKNTLTTEEAFDNAMRQAAAFVKKDPVPVTSVVLPWCDEMKGKHIYAIEATRGLICNQQRIPVLKRFANKPEAADTLYDSQRSLFNTILSPAIASNPFLFMLRLPPVERSLLIDRFAAFNGVTSIEPRLVVSFRFVDHDVKKGDLDQVALAYAKGDNDEVRLPLVRYNGGDDPEQLKDGLYRSSPFYWEKLMNGMVLDMWYLTALP